MYIYIYDICVFTMYIYIYVCVCVKERERERVLLARISRAPIGTWSGYGISEVQVSLLVSERSFLDRRVRICHMSCRPWTWPKSLCHFGGRPTSSMRLHQAEAVAVGAATVHSMNMRNHASGS